MITENILSFVFNFVFFLIDLVPELKFFEDDYFSSVISQIAEFASTVNYYIPLETFSVCVTLIFSAFVICSAIHIFINLF